MKPRRGHISENCRPISEILSRIGDKWTALIITRLGDGPMRFSDLKRSVGGISQKVLTSTLRALERDGFVARTVYPTVPPSVDYRLTDFGHDLAVPLNALKSFAVENEARMAAARAAFDAVAGDVMPAEKDRRGATPAQPRIRAL